MEEYHTVVAVFVDHDQVEAAVKKLAATGFDNRHISVVGRAYDDDAKFGGFYGAGDRIKFWGELGAFWGGLWGWLGGLVISLPVVGHFIALGAFANTTDFRDRIRSRGCDRRRDSGGWSQRLGRRPLQRWHPARQRDRI